MNLLNYLLEFASSLASDQRDCDLPSPEYFSSSAAIRATTTFGVSAWWGSERQFHRHRRGMLRRAFQVLTNGDRRGGPDISYVADVMAQFYDSRSDCPAIAMLAPVWVRSVNRLSRSSIKREDVTGLIDENLVSSAGQREWSLRAGGRQVLINTRRLHFFHPAPGINKLLRVPRRAIYVPSTAMIRDMMKAWDSVMRPINDDCIRMGSTCRIGGTTENLPA